MRVSSNQISHQTQGRKYSITIRPVRPQLKPINLRKRPVLKLVDSSEDDDDDDEQSDYMNGKVFIIDKEQCKLDASDRDVEMFRVKVARWE